MPKSPKHSRRPAARSAASAPHQPFTAAETRARHDGWTRERQTGFLQALAESGCVEEACAAVGMSRQSAYRLRARVDAQGFRVAWDAALDYAIRRLSDACLSRALHGEVRPIFYKGEQIGERRVHDNKLAMFLLRYRDPLRYAATLDQMVYGGHVEAAALGLAKAIDRAADEAEGLWEPAAPPTPEPAPYSMEPVAEVRAQQAMAAILASDAPIYGSYERRNRLEDARRAHRLKESGYSSHHEWEEAVRAEEEAQRQAAFDDLDRVLGRNRKPAGDPARPAPGHPMSDKPEAAQTEAVQTEVAQTAVDRPAPKRGEPDSGADVPSPLSPSAAPPPAADPSAPARTAPGAPPRSSRDGPRLGKAPCRIEPKIRTMG